MAVMNMNLSGIAPHEGFRDILSEGRDTTKNWSLYQEAIFDFVSQDSGNAIVEAVAGSGKSTTIIEAMKLVQGSCIFLAFNKAIADELKNKGVNARTFHSLVFGPVMRAKGASGPSFDKLRRLCRQNMSRVDYELYANFAQKMAGLARQQGVGFLTPDVSRTYWEICEHHDIEPESNDADMDRAIELSQDLLKWSNESDMVDFDDMLYWAIRDNISLPKFDFIFVDEAQDTNMIQRAILQRIMTTKSRLIAVGDPAQAIYGFRGASSGALQVLAEEFSAVKLPLSISYRCPTSVVKYAQQWVSHIQAADNAIEGVTKHHDTAWDLDIFYPNDLVVCRKRLPLLQLAFKCIRSGIPVQILGRDIGENLKGLVRKLGAKTIDSLEKKLEVYRAREVAKASAAENDAKVELINDTAASLQLLMDGLKEDRRTIKGLEEGIDYLFKDKTKCIKLSTIHGSKGLEADRVFWLNRNECPSKWARQDWQKQEEVNLCYVAATRAKRELHCIEI